MRALETLIRVLALLAGGFLLLGVSFGITEGNWFAVAPGVSVLIIMIVLLVVTSWETR